MLAHLLQQILEKPIMGRQTYAQRLCRLDPLDLGARESVRRRNSTSIPNCRLSDRNGGW